MLGALATIWTIRLSLLCFFVSLLAWMWSDRLEKGRQWIRVVWGMGFLLFVGHVVCAFHFYHHWSHQAAIADTARQTKEMLGFSFGEGLYFSYLFLIVWGIDSCLQWLAPERLQKTPRWLRVSWLLYLVFIAFNGAAVFEGGVSRWGGILGVGLLCLSLLFRPRKGRKENHRSMVIF